MRRRHFLEHEPKSELRLHSNAIFEGFTPEEFARLPDLTGGMAETAERAVINLLLQPDKKLLYLLLLKSRSHDVKSIQEVYRKAGHDDGNCRRCFFKHAKKTYSNSFSF